MQNENFNFAGYNIENMHIWAFVFICDIQDWGRCRVDTFCGQIFLCMRVYLFSEPSDHVEAMNEVILLGSYILQTLCCGMFFLF